MSGDSSAPVNNTRIGIPNAGNFMPDCWAVVFIADFIAGVVQSGRDCRAVISDGNDSGRGWRESRVLFGDGRVWKNDDIVIMSESVSARGWMRAAAAGVIPGDGVSLACAVA